MSLLHGLKKLLAFMPGSFLVVYSEIAIESEDQNALVLNADGWLFAFDKLSRVVALAGKPVASFASVTTINIEHFTNGKRAEWWVLNLNLQGGKTVRIGRAADGTQASIAAAHVAGIMDKQVRVIQRSGF